jgi:hypothetical protein
MLFLGGSHPYLFKGGPTMKQAIVITFLLVLVLIVAVPLATADEEPLIITPYEGGAEFTANEGQEVIIRAGWGACTRGLAEAFRHAALVSMEIHLQGQLYLTVEPPSREYWTRPAPLVGGDPSACVMRVEQGWQTEWFYSLGILEAGKYEGYFSYTMTHQLPDGGDYDGDGKIDLFSGVVKEVELFTITVE